MTKVTAIVSPSARPSPRKMPPITASVFVIMYKQPKNAASAKATKEFFAWVFANGDEQAKKLDYVPLPPALVKQIQAYWAANFKF